MSAQPVLVDPERTAALRQRVLRPNQSLDEVAASMRGPETLAVALLDGDEVVSCVLAVPEPCPDPIGGGETWRLRGMATSPERRGTGAGSLVLGRMLQEIVARGGELVWCNARVPAESLYRRAGFDTTGVSWDDPEIGPHVRMWTRLRTLAPPGAGIGRNWLTSPAHERWLEAETDRLLEFGRRSVVATGSFARQGDDGAPQPGPLELWIACRMTHVYSLGHLLGRPGCARLVDHGLSAITDIFADARYGGWFSHVGPDGAPTTTTKAAYPHAFVILAASSATVAGRAGARGLLRQALEVSERHFWDEESGMVLEEWDRTFTTLDPYRGVNANMHTVEAYLAASDVTGEDVWLERALRIVTRVVHGLARGNSWRIPEHFDPDWSALPDYNAEAPADPFRPFGATIGHWLEWARLTLQARAALLARGREAPGWLLEDAAALFAAAVEEGWAVDGAPGFVYTVDWSGRPVVRERMHWVAAEAVGAAAALFTVTGDEDYARWYSTWWDYIDGYVRDRQGGSWWHELGPDNTVSRITWDTKADLYHAVQATLIPRLPLAPALAPALARTPALNRSLSG